MNLRPKDQIVLLAGLEGDAVRQQIWGFPELGASLRRLGDAGLVHAGAAIGDESSADWAGLTEPAGLAAARRLRHITLGELMAEHLPDRAGA